MIFGSGMSIFLAGSESYSDISIYVGPALSGTNTLTANGSTIVCGGNFENHGTWDAGTSTVIFDGTTVLSSDTTWEFHIFRYRMRQLLPIPGIWKILKR